MWTGRRLALAALALCLTGLPASSGIPEAPSPPPPAGPVIAAGARAAEPLFYIPDLPLSRGLQQYTYSLCAEEGVDYELALAVMWSESRFETDAVHRNGNGTLDSGLMQINDVNAEWMEDEYGVTDLMDAEQNIRAGVLLMGRLIAAYGEHDGLMAYRLGETGMKRAKADGLETIASVDKLLEKREEFKQMKKIP